MADPFYGEIRLLPYTYVPENWMPCNGQSLAISAYQALYSVIGTTYGGTTTTFKLPNLNYQGQASAVMGSGAGRDLTPRLIGQQSGQNTVVLNTSQTPSHSHSVYGVSVTATATAPGPAMAVANAVQNRLYDRNPEIGNLAPMAPLALASSGAQSVQAHENRQPFLALQFCICVAEGEYPPRPSS